MDGDLDDLETNSFLRTLRNGFTAQYDKAARNRWIICIPQELSLGSSATNRAFVETHILSPSPYFQNEYVTQNGRAVDIENAIITTKDGFRESRKVRILSESLFYNAESRSFRVLSLERPLEGGAKDFVPYSSIVKPRNTLREHFEFLANNPNNTDALDMLDRKLEEFNMNYIMVKGFLEHMARRLREIAKEAVGNMMVANRTLVDRYPKGRYRMDLMVSVESYCMGKVFGKVYTAMREFYREEDEQLQRIIVSLQSVTLSDIGMKPELQCDFATAIEELKKLCTLTTWGEKVACLKLCVYTISEAVEAKSLSRGGGRIILTTDEILPLFFFVIIQAAPCHIFIDAKFIHEFMPLDSRLSEAGFLVATLDATVEYLQRYGKDSARSRPPPVCDELAAEPNSRTRHRAASFLLLPSDSELRAEKTTTDTCSDHHPHAHVKESPRSEPPQPQPSPPTFTAAPAFIDTRETGGDDLEELGDFLASLRSTGDVSSRTMYE